MYISCVFKIHTLFIQTRHEKSGPNLNLFDDSIGQFAWDLRRLIVVWRAGCVDPSSMWRRGGGSGGAFCARVVLAACAESAGGGGASPCVV